MNECMCSKLWILVEWMNGYSYVCMNEWTKLNREQGSDHCMFVLVRTEPAWVNMLELDTCEFHK